MLKGGEETADLTPAPDANPAPMPERTPAGPSCREGLSETPAVEATAAGDAGKPRVVTAKRPNHVWHVDLTTVPTAAGFWTSWLPFAVAAMLAVLLVGGGRYRSFFAARDGLSPCSRSNQPPWRCAHSWDERSPRPGPPEVPCLRPRFPIRLCGLSRLVQAPGIKPPRYGAIGQHGSIAVIERFILTLKNGCLRVLLVPYRRETFLRELHCFGEWYNDFRPHTTLGGRTPDEVYHAKRPANRGPRFEPRPRWPRGSPCAAALGAGEGQTRCPSLQLQVSFFNGRRHLPLVASSRRHEAAWPTFPAPSGEGRVRAIIDRAAPLRCVATLSIDIVNCQ